MEKAMFSSVFKWRPCHNICRI